MANKPGTESRSKKEPTPNVMSQFQDAGLGNMAGLSAAWMEALGDMGSELASFVADRIKEDVKTQHEIMNCKNAADLQHVQAQFLQTAITKYQAETGKLVEMSMKAFSKNGGGKTS